MSTADAEAFLQRLEDDEQFAQRMQEVSGDPASTHERAAAEGYAFTADEMVDALASAYGVELTTEQLEQIAAGGNGSAELLTAAVGRPLFGSVVLGAAAG